MEEVKVKQPGITMDCEISCKVEKKDYPKKETVMFLSLKSIQQNRKISPKKMEGSAKKAKLFLPAMHQDLLLFARVQRDLSPNGEAPRNQPISFMIGIYQKLYIIYNIHIIGCI